ncbi:MAG: NAD(P)H-dependent oxidoreductase [Bacteroides sp.]|nr:NAD(P)H-dependent oxidoreductase [Bacteroides sp.]
MKSLIVYFSYTAGNTKGIAEKIRAAAGGDLICLEPIKPYSADYNSVVSQGQEEVNSGYMPGLKPFGINIRDYDRVIVGTPTWWYKMSPVILSFLSNNDFTGKVVVPFMTNAGWPGSVIKDMTALAIRNGATVENAGEFKFSSNESNLDKMMTSETELDKWIDCLV